jgi:hypothetical protein
MEILKTIPSKKMLGEQIKELKGKVIGQRVLDIEGPTMEASVSVRGSAKGIPINGSITYVTRPSSPGVLRGKAQGVLTSEELEMVTFTAEGIGRITTYGMKVYGAVFLSTGSTGKLAFLNDVVGIFEAEIDTEGNFSEETWELKY